MADRNGYIGRAPSDSAVQVARQNFTPTGVQTNFTFDAGYTPGYLDVYLNGAKLVVAQDFTATDGSVVGLSSAAASGDIIELVAFKAFNAASVNNAGTLTVSGNQTNNGTLSVTGGTTLSNLNVTGISTLGTVSSLDLNGGVLTLDADGDTTITADTDDQIDIAFGGNDRLTLSTGLIDLKNDGSQSAIRLYCESSNAHYAALQAPAHSAFSGNITLTLPATTDTLVARTTTDTLTNKTLTSPTISTPTLTGGVGIADSIFHTGDDNTQIRFPAADTFTVETAGSERIRVTSAGLVGIGSDTPSRMLVVSGSDPIIRSEDSDNVSDFAEFKQLTGVLYIDSRNGASDGTIVFRGVGGGSATERLRITSAGNVSIQNDSGKFTAGASDDLEVYHDGSHSYVKDNGTGNLKLISNGTAVHIEKSDGENIAIFRTDGSVDLYYDNSKKFETTTSGVDVTGTVTMDAVAGTNTNASLNVLFQTSAGTIDGGSGLTYNPGNDNLSVNGNFINLNTFRGSGGTVTLTNASNSSTTHVQVTDGIELKGLVTATAGAVAEIDTLTSASTVTPDFAASCNFTLTLGHNVTLANPSNLTAGQSGSIFLVQDGTGSRTITFGNQYDFAGGTAPTLSTAASSVDRLDYFVRTASSIHCVVTLAYS